MNKNRRDYSDVSARLLSLLDNLRVRYKKVVDTITKAPALRVEDFGIVIQTSKKEKPTFVSPTGETHLFYSPLFTEAEVNKFGSDLMWALIGAGYFAYLRENVPGGERIFQQLIINHGWGYKIIEKRKELWEGRKDKYFLLDRLKVIGKNMTLSEMSAHWPGFFDFLS